MIVKKFGGATLDTTQKIKDLAASIKNQLSSSDDKLLLVVSAMGSTTNELIQLSRQITSHPHLREMDMLLTTGERISAALLSMALNDLNISSLSLTGSQAGIVTNHSHSNAYIQNISPWRVTEAFIDHQIVVLAGFQGVSEIEKNITTLGRGGSDTSAIAMAASLKASHCEILKDVTGVFTADPKKVTGAKAIKKLDFEEALTITFWGAKVLHHRSLQIAARHLVNIYVGPSLHDKQEGTWIIDTNQLKKDTPMYESPEFLSITSHSKVYKLTTSQLKSASEALNNFKTQLEQNHISQIQILWLSTKNNLIELFLTGPEESLEQINLWSLNQVDWELSPHIMATVTLLCRPSTSLDLQAKALSVLEKYNHRIYHFVVTEKAFHIWVDTTQKNAIIQNLHKELLTEHVTEKRVNS